MSQSSRESPVQSPPAQPPAATPLPTVLSQAMPSQTVSSQTKQNQLFSGVYLRLLATQFVFGISFSAFLLLPKFLSVELGAGPDEIGMLSGAALLWSAACAPFIGTLAKRVSRKHLLAFAVLLEAGAAIGFVAVDAIGPLAYMLRACQGVAFVIVLNCTATFTADLAPPGQLARAIGFLGVAMMITNALSPLLVEPLADSLGWSTAFLLTGLLAFSCLIVVLGLPTDQKRPQSAVRERAFSPALLAVYYCSFLMGSGIGVMFTFVQPYALQLGASEVADFFLGYVPAAIFVRTVLGTWADRFGHVRVTVLGLSLYSAVVGGTAQLTPSSLALFGSGLGLAHGFLYPALSAAGLSRATVSMRSVFMGWYSFAFNAGFAVSVLVLGYVAKHAGYPLIFWLTAGLLLTGIPPLLMTFSNGRAMRVQTELG